MKDSLQLQSSISYKKIILSIIALPILFLPLIVPTFFNNGRVSEGQIYTIISTFIILWIITLFRLFNYKFKNNNLRKFIYVLYLVLVVFVSIASIFLTFAFIGAIGLGQR